ASSTRDGSSARRAPALTGDELATAGVAFRETLEELDPGAALLGQLGARTEHLRLCPAPEEQLPAQVGGDPCQCPSVRVAEPSPDRDHLERAEQQQGACREGQRLPPSPDRESSSSTFAAPHRSIRSACAVPEVSPREAVGKPPGSLQRA